MLATNSEIKTINKLICKIAKNDKKALSDLFDMTKHKLKVIATIYLKDINNADDVLSETYSKIYRAAKSFDSSKNGYNWIYQILKNTALDYNKRMSNKDEVPYDDQLTVVPNAVEEYNKIMEVKLALKELDDLQKEIIVLRFWEKNTFEEIAKKTNLNISKIYRIYDSAIEKLKSIYESLEKGR